MDATTDGDVVDVLLGQHEQVKALFSKIAAASEPDRQALFTALTQLLHVHESGEQQVVHPALRTGGDDDKVVAARLAEEKEADAVIAELTSLGVDHPEFASKFEEFHQAVLDHAAHEENEEFPRLRNQVPVEQLRMMAGELRSVQAMH
jgi:hemerythrin superfamily protein